MKRLWSAIWVSLTVALTLIGASAIPGQIEQWQVILSWLPQWLGRPVAEIGPAIALMAYLICAFVAASYSVAAFIWLMPSMFRFFIISWMWLRRRAGMSHWISETEAREVIRASDFFILRTDPNGGGFDLARLAQGAWGKAKSNKQAIIERRFVESLLREFEAYDPSAVNDDGYSRDDLVAWLDRLAEAEVDGEIGAIPRLAK